VTCTNNANEICGGENANSIYKVDLTCFGLTTSTGNFFSETSTSSTSNPIKNIQTSDRNFLFPKTEDYIFQVFFATSKLYF
jgi:hypothetical protein